MFRLMLDFVEFGLAFGAGYFSVVGGLFVLYFGKFGLSAFGFLHAWLAFSLLALIMGAGFKLYQSLIFALAFAFACFLPVELIAPAGVGLMAIFILFLQDEEKGLRLFEGLRFEFQQKRLNKDH